MVFSVTQNGEKLSKDKYTWDEKTKTFSTTESNLVLDFSEYDGCTFKTGDECTFDTSYDCTFKTGDSCTFKTGGYCTFDTGDSCTFDTGSECTFDTSYDCTFKTGDSCTFKTGPLCTFKTGDNCVVVRRDVYEVIELKEGQKIKLKDYQEKGYTIIEEKQKEEGIIELNGKKYKLIE